MEKSVRTNDEIGSFSVESLSLVDAPTPAAFDSLTRLAARMFGVPVALISIVQEEKDRQFFLSEQGVSEPWKSRRQTPLSHSFCQHVKRAGKPLIVSDARLHPLVKSNLAVPELGVVAYLGVPISTPDGCSVGALCVIEEETREWTDEDLANLTDLAICVNDEILLRAALKVNERAHRKSLRYSAMRESIILAFMAPGLPIHARFQELLRASCDAFGMKSGRISKIDCGQIEPLYEHDKGGQFAVPNSQSTLDALTRLVASECEHVLFNDLSGHDTSRQPPASARDQGSYVGTPLILDGALFGIIEFFSDAPKSEPWSEEELSILSIVSMFAAAHLGVLDHAATLRHSEERALLPSEEPAKANFG